MRWEWIIIDDSDRNAPPRFVVLADLFDPERYVDHCRLATRFPNRAEAAGYLRYLPRGCRIVRAPDPIVDAEAAPALEVAVELPPPLF